MSTGQIIRTGLGLLLRLDKAGLCIDMGEGNGIPLQYSCEQVLGASLVSQMVKNQLAMQETWVRSLG